MKKALLFLFAVGVIAYFLRVMYLPQGALTFGYDQARDAVQAQNILKGDIKIQGPPSSAPGLHHGVAWFYLLTPAYMFGPSPLYAAYWIAFINTLTVVPIFFLGYFMLKKYLGEKEVLGVGLLSAFLFAISFEATQYAVWLSNPTFAILTVPMMYLGLWILIDKSHSFEKQNIFGAVLAGLSLALSVQANVFLIYHIIPLLIWVFVARKRLNIRNYIFLVGSFLVGSATMILTEIKFGFTGIGGLLGVLTTQDNIIASKKLSDLLLLFLDQIGRTYSLNSYPSNVGYGAMFIIALIIASVWEWAKSKSSVISWQPFLATWLLASLSVVSLGGTATPFLLVGIGPAVSILMAIYLVKWWRSGYKLVTVFVMMVILFGNLSMIQRENIKGQTIFAIQQDMLLSKQKQAIDYIYGQSNGDQFSINTLTSPLNINIVWAYLFDTYGKEKYGYAPFFTGQSQVGQLISLPESNILPKHFLITEPLNGIPVRHYDNIINIENAQSSVRSSQNWGELVVENREPLN